MKKKVIWLFGLSGAGKTTIAKCISKKLTEQNIIHILLDGDELRSTVNKDLGYSEHDRAENIRRSAELANLISQQGILCICSFITPLKVLRDSVKNILKKDVKLFYIDTPLEECIRRDVKGLYKEAKDNKIKDFTGISAKFEFPDNEDDIVKISTINKTPEECAEKILEHVFKNLEYSK